MAGQPRRLELTGERGNGHLQDPALVRDSYQSIITTARSGKPVKGSPTDVGKGTGRHAGARTEHGGSQVSVGHQISGMAGQLGDEAVHVYDRGRLRFVAAATPTPEVPVGEP